MTLYEIDQALLDLADPETGEISDLVYAGEPPCRWKLGWSEVLYWQPRPDTSGLRGVDRERRRPA